MVTSPPSIPSNLEVTYSTELFFSSSLMLFSLLIALSSSAAIILTVSFLDTTLILSEPGLKITAPRMIALSRFSVTAESTPLVNVSGITILP